MTETHFIEIRDLQSGKSVIINAAGKTFGREGGGADVGIPDRAVSGRHARIYGEAGRWYLEDLKSSNGTMVAGTRITRPAELRSGLRFALFRYEFEVLRQSGEGGEATAVWEGNQPPAAARRGASPAPGPRPNRDPGSISRTDVAVPTSVARPAATTAASDEPLADYLLREVPKAFAYYLVAVPLLLLRPLPMVKQGIAQMRFGAMGPRELITYGSPPLLLGTLLASLGTIIVAIVHGGFGVGVIISLLIGVAIALVVAIILGFVFHPVLAWLIQLLRGESDDVSRSNCFVVMQTAMPLQQVAAFFGLVLSLAPVPFVGIVGPVVALIATLITLFVAFSWLTYFRVMKWVPIVVVVLGALSGFGTVKAMVGTARTDIARFGSRTSQQGIAETATPGASSGGVVPLRVDSTGRPVADSDAMLRQAAEVSAQAQRTLERGVPPTPAVTTATAPSVTTSVVVAPTQPSPGAEHADDAPGGAYERYVERRRRVEQAIDKDPTLLNRPGVLPLYRQMLKATVAAKQKHKVKLGKKPTVDQQVEARIADRLRDAEIYDATSTLVDRLVERIFGES